MLESFFCLAACESVPNFAARKTIWEMREFIRRATNLRSAEPNDQWLVAERSEILSAIQKIEARYQRIPNERPWNINRVLEACEEVAFLKTNYFLLSEHAHGSFIGLTARHEDRHTFILQQSVLGTLIMGAGFAAQVVPTATPQGHVDKSVELMGDLLESMECGAPRATLEESDY